MGPLVSGASDFMLNRISAHSGSLTHWIVIKACDRWPRTKAARGGLNRTNLTIAHSTSAEATRLAIAQVKYVLIAPMDRLERAART